MTQEEKDLCKTYKHYYCSKYGNLSGRLCHKMPANNDDWDELEDPCESCGWLNCVELEMHAFPVKCKKDCLGAKAGDTVEAYVSGDIIVANGRMTFAEEFKEHFDV